MLIKGDNSSYIGAVEYIIQESGMEYEGGHYEWEGSFVPALPFTLSVDNSYVLELEDGRRGLVRVLQRRVASEEMVIYRFEGHAGIHQQ